MQSVKPDALLVLTCVLASEDDVFSSEEEARVYTFLPEEQVHSIQKCRRPLDRTRRLLVRLLLQKGSALFFPAMHEHIFRYLSIKKKGKPFLLPCTHSDMYDTGGLSLSLSHAGLYAVCALGRSSVHGALGVDVERVQSLCAEDLRAVFTKEEMSSLSRFTGVEQARECIRLWTRKEAWLKMQGAGFLEDPQTVSVLECSEVLSLGELVLKEQNAGQNTQHYWLSVAWEHVGITPDVVLCAYRKDELLEMCTDQFC